MSYFACSKNRKIATNFFKHFGKFSQKEWRNYFATFHGKSIDG